MLVNVLLDTFIQDVRSVLIGKSFLVRDKKYGIARGRRGDNRARYSVVVQVFQEIFRRPRDVFIGVLAQFTIMPLLAYGLAKIF